MTLIVDNWEQLCGKFKEQESSSFFLPSFQQQASNHIKNPVSHAQIKKIEELQLN
ncbi:unnamed protein product, partial [Vitis vinifera]